MNLLRLINLSLEHSYCSNYCSNLVSNHGLIRLIRFVSQFTSKLCNQFLSCLDLILHAYKILIRCDSFGILNFATKQGLRAYVSVQRFAVATLRSVSDSRFSILPGHALQPVPSSLKSCWFWVPQHISLFLDN